MPSVDHEQHQAGELHSSDVDGYLCCLACIRARCSVLQHCGIPAQLLWHIQILGICYIVVAVVVNSILPYFLACTRYLSNERNAILSETFKPSGGCAGA